ncbi:hypothetical protein KY289_024830 [Solanum tuberosum]|nr:hypothetical protein KY289_024830 [Solanum tuberosum]
MMAPSGASGSGSGEGAGGSRFRWASELADLFGSSSPANSEAAPPIAEPYHPLQEDGERLRELAGRLTINTIGLSLARGYFRGGLLRAQFQTEFKIEEALRSDRVQDTSLFEKRHLIRGEVFYPFGKPLSLETYLDHLSQIENYGTHRSLPYKRVLQALWMFLRGKAMLGRVVDGLGVPIDGRGALSDHEKQRITFYQAQEFSQAEAAGPPDCWTGTADEKLLRITEKQINRITEERKALAEKAFERATFFGMGLPGSPQDQKDKISFILENEIDELDLRQRLKTLHHPRKLKNLMDHESYIPRKAVPAKVISLLRYGPESVSLHSSPSGNTETDGRVILQKSNAISKKILHIHNNSMENGRIRRCTFRFGKKASSRPSASKQTEPTELPLLCLWIDSINENHSEMLLACQTRLGEGEGRTDHSIRSLTNVAPRQQSEPPELKSRLQAFGAVKRYRATTSIAACGKSSSAPTPKLEQEARD